MMAFLAAAVPAVISMAAPVAATLLPGVAIPTTAAGLAGAASVAAGSLGSAGALTMGASALSAVGVGVGAIAEKRAQDFNARVADIQGAQAVEQAAIKASEIQRRGTQTQAEARTAIAQSGLELTGSQLDLLKQQQRQIELDALSAVYEGRVAQASAQTENRLARSRGRSALLAGVMGAGQQALSGRASYLNSQTRAKQAAG